MRHAASVCRTVTTLTVTMLLLTAVLTSAGVPASDLAPPSPGHSQILKLNDGTTLTGSIVEVNDEAVVFESSVGTVTVQIEKIESITEVANERVRSGKYWFPNPNQTRMYFGPTGRMLEKGKGYFSDVYIFFPSIAYALTDNITIGGGMSLFPGLDLEEQLFYFTPKVGVTAAKNLSLALSGLIVRVPDWGDDDGDLITDDDEPTVVGTLFGVATYGNEDKSVTGGLGFGYVDDDFGDKPVVLIGGEYRVGQRLSLVSENWVLPGIDPAMISYGVRFFGEGIAVDLALINVASDDAIFPGLPFIDFVWNF